MTSLKKTDTSQTDEKLNFKENKTENNAANKIKARAPEFFSIDDPRLVVQDMPADDLNKKDFYNEAPTVDIIKSKGINWLTLLISALAGLVLLSASLWVTSFVTELLYRRDWVGWLALALVILASFSVLMLMLLEIKGLRRLKTMKFLHQEVQHVLEDKDKQQAQYVIKTVKSIFSDREDVRWGLARLQEHEKDILDARELLILTERELLQKLDVQASELIASSARRVSVITALSPVVLVDVIGVSYQNLTLLRQIAMLYGSRPGFIGSMRLMRMVLTHITLTGGIALSSDVLQQFIGHKLSAKLSAKLGEGIFNGAMTARIGLAAMDICRPLPFIAARKPLLREFLAALVKIK